MRPLIGIPCQGNLRSRYRRYCVGQSYCRAVETAGGVPLLLPLLETAALPGAFLRLDGLLLAGGGDVAPRHYGEVRRVGLSSVDPPRDRVELWLARRSVEDNLPFLAVCRGIQVLNIALGGTLHQDIPTAIAGALRHSFRFEHPRNYLGHKVQVEPDTRLAQIMGPGQVSVNSFHHQSIKDVAPELVVTALAPDGVIEGVEVPGLSFAVGVQWHPEELVDDDPRMLSLFRAFVAAAGG